MNDFREFLITGKGHAFSLLHSVIAGQIYPFITRNSKAIHSLAVSRKYLTQGRGESREAIFLRSLSPNIFCHFRSIDAKKYAFSLVEMLMALLVASLLMAALAHVMTRKFGDNIGITVEGQIPGKKTHTHEIKYEDENNCNDIEEKDGYSICKGSFSVPTGYNGPMLVTAVGGGGGGGTSSTTGTKDYTVSSSGQQLYDFVVPQGVTEIEVTMISGGAGGGAGGLEEVTVKEISDKTGGVYTWSVPDVVKGKNVLAYGCAGGGGGGGAPVVADVKNVIISGGNGNGGAGGYRTKTNAVVVKIPDINTISYQVGGGGGGGSDGHSGCGAVNPGKAGNCGGGGDGGSDDGAVVTNSCNPAYGGTSAIVFNCTRNRYSIGGTGGVISDGINRAGTGVGLGVYGRLEAGGSIAQGGAGSSGGNGGASGLPYPTFTRAYSYSAGGGGGYFGGGGGGGACQGTGGGGGGPTYFYGKLIASGGGGGGGASDSLQCTGSSGECFNCPGGGGGGGGGLNGGQGGAGANVYGQYEYRTYGANGGSGSPKDSTTYPSDRCTGGDGGKVSTVFAEASGSNGKDGILYVTYLGPKNGGSGGGGGQIVPRQRIKVIPGETLTVFVGRGSKGGEAGYIKDDGTIVWPKNGGSIGGGRDYSAVSKITRGNSVLLTTDPGNRNAGQHSGPAGGCPSGLIQDIKTSPYCGCLGYVTNGVDWIAYQTSVSGIEGFTNTNGKPANGTTGGAGGTTTIFGNTTCTPGAGGTTSSPDGKKGTGYGCGGGGGAPFGRGGDGTDGLVRISWNPDRIGYGGGGGSAATIIEKSIMVKSGSVFKYQIASGGYGGKTELENGKMVIKHGSYGGDTIFGTNVKNNKITAGGGYGGLSVNTAGELPSIALNNGSGGKEANICKIDSYLLTCHGIFAGEDGNNKKGGGNGAKSNYGPGGSGSKTGVGEKAKNEGAGGGGAGIKETGAPNDYPYEGGKGGEGKIILKWYE